MLLHQTVKSLPILMVIDLKLFLLTNYRMPIKNASGQVHIEITEIQRGVYLQTMYPQPPPLYSPAGVPVEGHTGSCNSHVLGCLGLSLVLCQTMGTTLLM